jgi:hypothetical protein
MTSWRGGTEDQLLASRRLTMPDERGRWAICFNLDERLEVLDAMIGVWEEKEIRTVVSMVPGPFDSPDDILATFLELIDHAQWRGEQLRLPVSTVEQ